MPNFRLEFTKASKDGSGKATLAPSQGERVTGVIFDIDDCERADLDRYEGMGHGYWRDEKFAVEGVASGQVVLTNTYIATSFDSMLKPFDWYLATIIAGAIHHEIDEPYIAALRETAFIEDHDKDRNTRVAAIRAMQDHGIDDFRTLLRGLR